MNESTFKEINQESYKIRKTNEKIIIQIPIQNDINKDSTIINNEMLSGNRTQMLMAFIIVMLILLMFLGKNIVAILLILVFLKLADVDVWGLIKPNRQSPRDP